jgi:predicted kinase
MNTKNLIILRGLPGSGKSSLAHIVSEESAICEADKFFYDTDGNYNFDATKLRQAHEWCRNEVERRMNSLAIPNIVVSNTFTQEWEMEAYYKLAEQYGYRVFSVIVENRHSGINIHGVPEDTLYKMKNRFEVSL